MLLYVTADVQMFIETEKKKKKIVLEIGTRTGIRSDEVQKRIGALTDVAEMIFSTWCRVGLT